MPKDMLSVSTLPSEIPQETSMKTAEPLYTLSDNGDFDFSKLLEKPRPLNIERQRSFDERSLSELSAMSPHLHSRNADTHFEGMLSPCRRSVSDTPRSTYNSFEPHPTIADAWDTLRRSLVYFRGKPVGTIAAMDHSEELLNYNQVFVRDFIPSALAFLINGEPEIVRNFLLKTLRLQAWEKQIDRFTLGEGVMPASFKVLHDPDRNTDTMIADFGESAIGRVAPVDSGFWWIILLRAYTKSTGDHSLADMPDCQRGMRLILTLCLSEGFDTFPTLLCADGCCMVDRRMGIYGYPIEIQALFYMALRCARQLLKPDDGGKEFIERIDKRLHALSYHMRSYFWLDFQQLNDIYRYKTEEYSHTAVNKFNVIPDSLPDWVFDFMPMKGGYFIGNVSPARMDFRWFCLGNCVAILSCLATPEQSMAIMDLIEERWDELVGEMPLKVAYPAIENHEWRIVTGCDPKNTRWSYHNGGSWPVLLWLLTAACIKTGRPHIAKRAIELAERRLSKDGWPEYYDGKLGRYIGKQARKFQTWSVAGYLVAKMMLEDPSHLGMISLEEDKKIKPPLTRSHSWTC
jgi:glycogen debranching enzyme